MRQLSLIIQQGESLFLCSSQYLDAVTLLLSAIFLLFPPVILLFINVRGATKLLNVMNHTYLATLENVFPWTALNLVSKIISISKKHNGSYTRIQDPACSKSIGVPDAGNSFTGISQIHYSCLTGFSFSSGGIRYGILHST